MDEARLGLHHHARLGGLSMIVVASPARFFSEAPTAYLLALLCLTAAVSAFVRFQVLLRRSRAYRHDLLPNQSIYTGRSIWQVNVLNPRNYRGNAGRYFVAQMAICIAVQWLALGGLPACVLRHSLKRRGPVRNATGLILTMILGAGCRPSVGEGIAHLPSGDSVQLLEQSAAVVPGEPSGLLIGYHPFVPLEDTVRMQQIAVEVWHAIAQDEVEERGATWVVLQARSAPVSGIAPGMKMVATYGVVLERRADGRWYMRRSGKRLD